MEDIEKLKKELEYYKKKFSVGGYDIAIDGYLSYVNLVKQQVEFIKDFEIKAHIDGKKAETVLYERAISMGEGLPDMISKMNRLKIELNIPFDENEGKPKLTATSPQNIGKNV
jgi:hypothetical protein